MSETADSSGLRFANAPVTLETLAERAEAMAAEHRRVPSLDLVRAALNETGIRRARAVLMDAPDILANAQESLRTCQAVETAAREEYDAAVAEASWVLDERFFTEGNKTYLAEPCDHPGLAGGDAELCAPCDGTGVRRSRAMTADQRRAWVAAEAAKMPAVTKAAEALRVAAGAAAAARDSVELAKVRVSVARHDLDAAVAELEALVVAIPRGTT